MLVHIYFRKLSHMPEMAIKAVGCNKKQIMEKTIITSLASTVAYCAISFCTRNRWINKSFYLHPTVGGYRRKGRAYEELGST